MSIEATADAIYGRRTVEHVDWRGLLHRLDSLLEEVEQLHLQDGTRVHNDLYDDIADLCGRLKVPMAKPGGTSVKVMDALYAAEATVMLAKHHGVKLTTGRLV